MPPSPAAAAATLVAQILAGDRAALARAITLVESRRPDDQETAYEALRRLMPEVGRGRRIGVSGPPGVGKSTLIDAWGLELIRRGRRVAVLAVDPSSSLSGGSILGDKSRMSRLAREESAFIRPSPSDLELGGVARRTREAMFLCEAAGFDHVLVETMGVGQSEIRVAGMVDAFVVLIQPGAGDELQGIKKGILELADVLAVAKADGPYEAPAREAAAEYSAALRYLGTEAEILTLSAMTGDGIGRLADLVDARLAAAANAGTLEARRATDGRRWITELAEEILLREWRAQAGDRGQLGALVSATLSGELDAGQAARRLLGR
ncbi:MAG: methylmalonyl Co-A mutase-associated GTPase MeaB [Acidobacteriota bacterium]|nr:methylmalonyl Co-A mutase-associated GTPase MeaB [Acidobacteriota bacterium]MDH3525273.1 methylmalonyl Co-A mutase-associated GTPase MeaB [Acidobacteriota bacterium]